MLQQWNLRSRGHQCAVTERPFEDGERHFTAIYIDPKSSEYTRRDVCVDAWKQELAERTPFSFWKSVYVKNAPDQKPEFAPKESALSLLQRLIEDDHPHTENARYILAAMLERKRILSPTDRKYTEQGIMQFYENKKTGDVYMIRDPELRLDEVAGVQEEVAMLLGFGGPAAEAAKAVGMKITPEGKVEPAGDSSPEVAASEAPSEPPAAEETQPVEAETAEVEAAEPDVQEPESTESEPLAEEPATESEVEEEEGDIDPDFEDEDEMEPDADEEDIEFEVDQEEDDEVAAEPDTFEPGVDEPVVVPEEPVETTTESASPEPKKKKTATPRRPAIQIEVYETEVTGEDEGENVMEPEYDDTEDDKR